ncbi:MAG: hypothetical protein M0R34_05885 [Candidatus Marinimicrobia bacterium]|nr:hypothetical protein [Candidatus Neomarinimicrobiota bacterium]
MTIHFVIILGSVIIALALLMLALKFSHYKGEKHGGHCGGGCHYAGEENCGD